MNVAIDLDLAEIAIRIGLSGVRALEEARNSLNEVREAREGVEAAPPALLLEIALDTAERSTESEVMPALAPNNVVRQRKLILYFKQWSVDAGPDGRIACDIHASVLTALREEIERGSLIRALLHVCLARAGEAEAQQVYQRRRENTPVFHCRELVASLTHLRPAGGQRRTEERLNDVPVVANVAHKQGI